jgi:hypothetical protein
MAFFRIKEPNQPPKYIKSVDGANETLEFTNTTENAYYKDSGFFADSEYEFLMFHFKKKYPELQYMEIDTGWHRRDTEVLNEVPGEQEEQVEVANAAVWGDYIGAVEEGPQAPIVINNAEQFVDAYNENVQGVEAIAAVDIGNPLQHPPF